MFELLLGPRLSKFFGCTTPLLRYIVIEVRDYGKILFIQNIVENGWWGNAYAAYPTSSPGCIIMEKFYSSKTLLKMAGGGMHTQHTPHPPLVV